MTSSSHRDLIIGRILRRPSHIPRVDFIDSLEPPEYGLDTPEASSTEIRFLDIHIW